MTDCRPKPTPVSPGTILVTEGQPLRDATSYRSIVASLNYLAVNTRPDLSHVVGILSKFMQWPTKDHMKPANMPSDTLIVLRTWGLYTTRDLTRMSMRECCVHCSCMQIQILQGTQNLVRAPQGLQCFATVVQCSDVSLAIHCCDIDN
jgi:hypothetical protein